MKKRKSTVPTEAHYVAVIDDSGKLVGYDEVSAIDTRMHVEVPRECDLTPGKYRWNDRLKRFDPIQKKAPEPMAPIVGALIAIRDGQPLPAVTLEFLNWWETHKSNMGDN